MVGSSYAIKSTTSYQDQGEHESEARALLQQATAEEASNYRDGRRSTEEHLADRTQPSSLSGKLRRQCRPGLIAYTYREKKPSLNIEIKELLQLAA